MEAVGGGNHGVGGDVPGRGERSGGLVWGGTERGGAGTRGGEAKRGGESCRGELTARLGTAAWQWRRLWLAGARAEAHLDFYGRAGGGEGLGTSVLGQDGQLGQGGQQPRRSAGRGRRRAWRARVEQRGRRARSSGVVMARRSEATAGRQQGGSRAASTGVQRRVLCRAQRGEGRARERERSEKGSGERKRESTF